MYPINKMIKLTKKAIELLDAVTSVPYSGNGLGYILWGVVWMPSYLSPATPTVSPATLTIERKINEGPVSVFPQQIISLRSYAF
jgi:hypothetical protein